jgi:predicted ArsR family transcriptional regulator
MSAVNISRRFLETTRGRIVGLLRTGAATVEDLARSLGLTDNAIRSHLATLERDGLVRQDGVRRSPGAGKPATIYEIHPEAEPLFSRAYVPVLAALLDELAAQLPEEQSDDLMRGVGRRLASAVGRAPAGELPARAEAAVALLNSLGGAAQLDRADGKLVIRGCGGCPLSAATSRRPELCRALESLLSEYVGAPVQECCDRGERPRCHFEIPTAA